MKISRDDRFRRTLWLVLSTLLAAGFGASTASAKPSPQNGGSGSGGQSQQSSPQNRPQARPQQRPQSSQPQGRPTAQPARPQPGRPTIQPTPGPRPNPGYRPGPGKPPYARPLPPYQFRPIDRHHLQHYYRRNFGYINRGRRPVFVIGGYVPLVDRRYFTPLPPHMLGYLPPPPPGYVVGYFDGYCVVYNPTTFQILSFVDLLN